jgi:methyl-accepting chemotaxis protein
MMDIGAATNEQSKGSSQIAHETNRLNALTLEINCTINEQASGTQAVLKSMEHMRELVQQNSSGATRLAAAAEQMSTMSRGLLTLMDRFKLEAENAPMRELPQRRAARLGDSYERVLAVPGKVQ